MRAENHSKPPQNRKTTEDSNKTATTNNEDTEEIGDALLQYDEFKSLTQDQKQKADEKTKITREYLKELSVFENAHSTSEEEADARESLAKLGKRIGCNQRRIESHIEIAGMFKIPDTYI